MQHRVRRPRPGAGRRGSPASPRRPVTRIATPSRARAVLSAASGRSTGVWPRASSTPNTSRAQWMSVAQRLGQRLDLDAGERRRVRQLRREDAVDEDQPHPVDAVEDRRLVGRPAAPPARRRQHASALAGSVKRQYSSRRDRRAALGQPPRRARARRPRPGRLAARARARPRAAPARASSLSAGPPPPSRHRLQDAGVAVGLDLERQLRPAGLHDAPVGHDVHHVRARCGRAAAGSG